MATHHGDEGAVYSDTTVVAEVTDFDYTEVIGKAKDSAKGDANESYKAGRKDGSGKISCWWDPSDTSGQNTLRVGQTVTLHLYPEGKATAYTDLNGAVLIDLMTITSPKDESICEATINFTGVLTWGAVPAPG